MSELDDFSSFKTTLYERNVDSCKVKTDKRKILLRKKLQRPQTMKHLFICTGVSEKSRSLKFSKIHWKTPALNSLFQKSFVKIS